MSDASGKVIGTMLLNGVVHAFFPIIGLLFYKRLSAEDYDIRSSTAFFSVLLAVTIGSFIMNYASFAIIQGGVCGKVFQPEHLMNLAGMGLGFTIVFLVISWYVGFFGDIIRGLIPVGYLSEEFRESAVTAFYQFWGGMYSVATLSWYATACQAPDVDKPLTVV
jgi:hypothetical protein